LGEDVERPKIRPDAFSAKIRNGYRKDLNTKSRGRAYKKKATTETDQPVLKRRQLTHRKGKRFDEYSLRGRIGRLRERKTFTERKSTRKPPTNQREEVTLWRTGDDDRKKRAGRGNKKKKKICFQEKKRSSNKKKQAAEFGGLRELLEG